MMTERCCRTRTTAITAMRIELECAEYFNYRLNLIVPNVSWMLGRREADLVVLRPSNYAVEVEIKVSASDLKADLKKWHGHKSRLFRELWFAVPDALKDPPAIPERAGILAITGEIGSKYGRYRVNKIRPAKHNPIAIKWTPEQREKLLHLAAMRIWGLKSARLHHQCPTVMP